MNKWIPYLIITIFQIVLFNLIIINVQEVSETAGQREVPCYDNHYNEIIGIKCIEEYIKFTKCQLIGTLILGSLIFIIINYLWMLR